MLVKRHKNYKHLKRFDTNTHRENNTDCNKCDKIVAHLISRRDISDIESLTKTIRTLIPYCNNPDVEDEYGKTPLMWAATYGYLDIVKALAISGKVNINKQQEDGWTPLIFAAINGQNHIVTFLIQLDNIEINKRMCYGDIALMYASSACAPETVNEMILRGTDIYFQALITKPPSTTLHFQEISPMLIYYLRNIAKLTKILGNEIQNITTQIPEIGLIDSIPIIKEKTKKLDLINRQIQHAAEISQKLQDISDNINNTTQNPVTNPEIAQDSEEIYVATTKQRVFEKPVASTCSISLSSKTHGSETKTKEPLARYHKTKKDKKRFSRNSLKQTSMMKFL